MHGLCGRQNTHCVMDTHFPDTSSKTPIERYFTLGVAHEVAQANIKSNKTTSATEEHAA